MTTTINFGQQISFAYAQGCEGVKRAVPPEKLIERDVLRLLQEAENAGKWVSYLVLFTFSSSASACRDAPPKENYLDDRERALLALCRADAEPLTLQWERCPPTMVGYTSFANWEMRILLPKSKCGAP
jgi:hypothetical protein